MWCTNVIRELKGLRYSQEEAALSNHGDHVGVHRLYVHQKKIGPLFPTPAYRPVHGPTDQTTYFFADIPID